MGRQMTHVLAIVTVAMVLAAALPFASVHLGPDFLVGLVIGFTLAWFAQWALEHLLVPDNGIQQR
jgi:membrane protease YdiL (CAAX protease family)